MEATLRDRRWNEKPGSGSLVSFVDVPQNASPHDWLLPSHLLSLLQCVLARLVKIGKLEKIRGMGSASLRCPCSPLFLSRCFFHFKHRLFQQVQLAVG